jgi:hypothetical protein
MHLRSIFVAGVLLGFLSAGQAGAQQVAADEQEFRQLVAALKADDAERRSAIAVCTKQGIGDNPAGAAQFMGVPVEQAAQAWCTRMTNGIANGRLGLADMNALNEGTITPAAQAVLTTVSEGK